MSPSNKGQPVRIESLGDGAEHPVCWYAEEIDQVITVKGVDVHGGWDFPAVGHIPERVGARAVD